jgi:internalin A
MSEAKIILVGRGSSGKTSLAARLTRGRFDPRVKKTAGIHITEWSPDASLRLNVWDFGGQELMHAAHQFFFTEDSLYLLVLSAGAGREDADVEYWLKLVGCFAPRSPVVVVLNKISEREFDVNRRALEGKYPALRGFFETDCEDGTGIERLREEVVRLAAGLPTSEHAPTEWAEVESRVRGALRRGFIEFDEFRRLCVECGLVDGAGQESLASRLHRAGTIVTYLGDRRLQDAHVFEPRWVTEAVYRLLNSEALDRQRGIIRPDQLARLLGEEKYPEPARRLVLDLMGLFDLCFRLPDGEYLFPELLGKAGPGDDEALGAGDRLGFQYHYDVLPPGLLPRFVARTRELSEGRERWRTGVVLGDGPALALVRADPVERRVLISVAGPEAARRELLTSVRAEFGRIHRDLAGLTPRGMVPLPEHPDTLVQHAAMMAFERAGTTEGPTVAGGEVVTVNYSRLLDLVGRDVAVAASA